MRCSLIAVYTVCQSVCIFWTHFCTVKPHCSNLRIITAIFLYSFFCRIFTVNYDFFFCLCSSVANLSYCKFPKYSDTQKICCNHSKIWTMWLYHRVMSPNDADGMANSVDPDQTAPLGAVWSGSALFAQTCLSENLGSLLYVLIKCCVS